MNRTEKLRAAEVSIRVALGLVSDHLNDLADECAHVDEAERHLRSAMRVVRREANWHEGR